MKRLSISIPSMRLFLCFFPFFIVCWACSSTDPYPRPLAYPRIDFPENITYATLSETSCPFTFEYPDMGKITRTQPDSCWIDIYFPQYKATWHITHRNTAETLLSADLHYEEWRRLIFQHTKKASQIQDEHVQLENGAGFFYEIYGNVGTPAQFFFHDPKGNDIVMMNCYFQTAMKNDSLAPVIDFMKKEMKHLMASIKWNVKYN